LSREGLDKKEASGRKQKGIKQPMAFTIGLLLFLAVWLSPVVWAWKTGHPERKFITFLTLFFGPVGCFVSLIIISSRNLDKAKSGEAGTFTCEHCGAHYRLTDYSEDAAIFCEMCKENISRPALEKV
jgi:hypothetical protein